MSRWRVKIDTLNLYNLKISFVVSPENNEWKMNLESLLSGLTIASIFLLTSELWLEFVMSAFRKGQSFGCWTSDVQFLLSRNQADSYTTLDFWSQLVCVIVRKSLLLCSCFHLCPRWWNYYDWSVEKWEEKDSSGVSKWSNSIQFHHLTLYPVFAWYLLLLSPFHLLPGCLFFHHENVL